MRSNKHVASAAAGFGIIAVGVAIWTGPAASAMGSGPAVDTRQVLHAYANLPLAFVENQGQTDPRVRYYAQDNRRAFYLTREEIMLSFVKEETRGLALALRFLGSNPRAVLEGEEPAAGEVHYLHGKDPARWQTQLRRYGQVVYRELWPGVDLRLRDQAGALKYEFLVRPGARPADIRLAYAGAAGLSLDDSGALLIKTELGVLRDSPPVSYQVIAGARVPVTSRYVLAGAGRAEERYGFAVGAGYRRDHELIIDPGVEYSTFLGGSSHEIGAGLQVDANGNAYVVGTTQSPNFPTTPGAFRRTGAASNFGDVFVSKLNPAGTSLVYSTFIGGSNFDWGRGIAVDAAGHAYVTGQTKSANFPTTGGAFDRTFNVDTCPRCGIDQYDAFALKLNATGSALVYSTFLGGFNLDDGMAIAVDGSGSAYVAGETEAANFPTTAGAFDRSRNGAFDTFVTKLNAAGSALVFSTYLGGAAVEFPARIAVDAGRNVFVTGSTSSADFPTTSQAFDPTANGAFDVFVTKLNSTGSALVYSSFLGGAGFDSGGGLDLDSAGNAYLSGGTGSFDFPTTPGAFDTLADGSEAFVSKLNPAGSALVYSTLLGGTASDGASAVSVDGAGNAWVTGATSSADFPVIVGAADSTHNGMSDVFVSELNADGSALLYSTYLGGNQSESGNDLALDASGGVYVTGHTFSANYPTTAGAFDIVFNGDLLIFWGDGFVTKLGSVSTPPSTPPVPAAPALISPANGENAAQPITFQWNIASGAVSYTIQIDDSSAFSAPLVREQQNINTLLMYATSGLTTATHFWRVRGVNTAGVAGPWSAVRTVTPGPAPPPPGLGSLDTNPSTVVGGNASFGTVVLSTGAPFGGAAIILSSSNPGVASVPAAVTAPENSFTGSFTITTSPVAASTTVTITAAYNGTTRTATLTVTPAGPPPPPAQTAALTVTASGRSGERITSSPSAINVRTGSSAVASFTSGTSITLSVSGGRDAIWSGACSSGGNKRRSCTFTLTGPASVSANVQ